MDVVVVGSRKGMAERLITRRRCSAIKSPTQMNWLPNFLARVLSHPGAGPARAGNDLHCAHV